ncbi:MAG: hypothetical protein JO080_09185 [Mucilaginibacter sp.]|nr:hypothetical protein [Mucilaginibacter sp.]
MKKSIKPILGAASIVAGIITIEVFTSINDTSKWGYLIPFVGLLLIGVGITYFISWIIYKRL